MTLKKLLFYVLIKFFTFSVLKSYVLLPLPGTFYHLFCTCDFYLSSQWKCYLLWVALSKRPCKSSSPQVLFSRARVFPLEHCPTGCLCLFACLLPSHVVRGLCFYPVYLLGLQYVLQNHSFLNAWLIPWRNTCILLRKRKEKNFSPSTGA